MLQDLGSPVIPTLMHNFSPDSSGLHRERERALNKQKKDIQQRNVLQVAET